MIRVTYDEMSPQINCLTALGVVSSFKCFVVYRRAFKRPSVPLWPRTTFMQPFTSTLLPEVKIINRTTKNQGLITLYRSRLSLLLGLRFYLLQMLQLDERDRKE